MVFSKFHNCVHWHTILIQFSTFLFPLKIKIFFIVNQFLLFPNKNKTIQVEFTFYLHSFSIKLKKSQQLLFSTFKPAKHKNWITVNMKLLYFPFPFPFPLPFPSFPKLSISFKYSFTYPSPLSLSLLFISNMHSKSVYTLLGKDLTIDPVILGLSFVSSTSFSI